MSSINKRFSIFGFLLIFSISTVFAQSVRINQSKIDALVKTAEVSLTTEKSEYVRGETAVIRGSGFRTFEEITLKVEQYDDQLQQEVVRGTWTAFADDKGNFVSNWEVPFNGKFTIKGVGAKSGQEVQTIIAASVVPVVFSGNPTCTDVNASSDPALAHVTSDYGLKIDPPTSGTFSFTNGGSRTLQGGAPANASQNVTVNLTSGTTMDWSANRTITAVVVKAGAGANVYPYNPFSFGDTNLVTPGGHGFSHLVFCFQPSVTTAARVSVSGRVTDQFGNGLPRTTMTILNSSTGEARSVISNSFGFYQFNELEVGNFYIVSAYNRRYVFESEVQTVSLNDAVENLDFRVSAK